MLFSLLFFALVRLQMVHQCNYSREVATFLSQLPGMFISNSKKKKKKMNVTLRGIIITTK